MTQKIIFLNDQFINYDQAFVHIEDRGFQLGDGVYEVILFENGKLIDFDDHINRLYRSASEISMKINKSATEFKEIFLELFKKNNLNSAYVYVQVTRGVAGRMQNFPNNYTTTINAIANPLPKVDEAAWNKGFKAITHEDIRWNRCDIKSICLLASNMMRQKAVDRGAVEAILTRNGIVTEGGWSNVFMVNNKNQILTHLATNHILQGITRNRIIKLARENGLEAIETKFSKEDLLNAKEVFLTSSSLKVRPISQVDDQIIGSGKTGEISKKLAALYNDFVWK